MDSAVQEMWLQYVRTIDGLTFVHLNHVLFYLLEHCLF